MNHYLSLGQPDNRHAPLIELSHIATHELGFKHHGLGIWSDSTQTKLTSWGSWKSASAPYVNLPFEGILILYKKHWKKEKKGVSSISKKNFMMGCSGIWNLGTDRKRLTMATFPEKLPELCIELFSYEDELVMDPFSGSGTTCAMAKKLGRNYVGIEISPNYCKIAADRIKKEHRLTRLFNNEEGEVKVGLF